MFAEDKNVLIVEDNETNMNLICLILKNIKGLNTFKANDSATAYKCAIENEIDVFIVDIILDTHISGDVSGIKFIERIRTIEKYKFCPIIITTSLEDPKLHSYTYLHCYRYFEKPYDNIEFEKTIREALNYVHHKEPRKYLYYKKEGILYSLKIEDIIYIENHSLYIHFHCKDGEYKAPYKPCKKLLEEICSEDFIQCSKNTIVNKNFIRNVDSVNRYITLMGKYGTIEIGPRMKKQFLSRLKND